MSHAEIKIDDVQTKLNPASFVAKLPLLGAVLFGVGLVATLGLSFDKGEFVYKETIFSWLVAFCYFTTICLGGMFFVLVQHAARAGWSVLVRRFAENLMGVLPWLSILFIPIFLDGFFGNHHLYDHWMGEHAAHDVVLQRKAAYLNVDFFFLRAAFYFLVWGGIAWFYRKNSIAQDESGDHALTHKMQFWSGACLLVFAFTTTFAAFDWIMSLEPHWFSTIFGGYFWIGGVVGCFAVLSLTSIALKPQLGGLISHEHYHDMGKFTWAFNVFWTYLAFSQFMLIWYANLPEETGWFQPRLDGWVVVSLVLLFGHFLTPFFGFMSRWLKRHPATLGVLAVYLLVMHYVDMTWLVMPTLYPEGLSFGLIDITTFMTVGGFWLFLFTRNLGRHALIPVKDPRLAQSVSFENF